MTREEFIKKEIWILTIAGAFQRANIYTQNVEKEKEKFKEVLYSILDELAKEYEKDVSESKHIENIHKINDGIREFQHILQENKLSFGVCQKLLNLYLKYLWCLDKIPTPPHFPVDRKIQEKMKLNVTSWTSKDFNEEQYLKVIEESKKLAKELSYNSIADFELDLFAFEGDINQLGNYGIDV